MKYMEPLRLCKDAVIGKSIKFHGKGQNLMQCNLSQLIGASTDIKSDSNESSLSPEEKSNAAIFHDSLRHPDFFGVNKLFTLQDLFSANVHLGHREGTLCNHMRPYIFGSRLGHLIFDLDQTTHLLRKALNVTAHIAFREGIILFICRSPQSQLMVEQIAEECNQFSHARHWSDGTFTNAKTRFGCVTRLPDLAIFLGSLNDILSSHPAIRECASVLIPTIGILDTNSDPRLITYPVPGNDDSYSALKLYCKLFKQAILVGREKRKCIKEEEF